MVASNRPTTLAKALLVIPNWDAARRAALVTTVPGFGPVAGEGRFGGMGCMLSMEILVRNTSMHEQLPCSVLTMPSLFTRSV